MNYNLRELRRKIFLRVFGSLPSSDIVDSYVLEAPSNQNILDLFKGEWSSQLPQWLDVTTAPGTAPLFEDDRVNWARDRFGGFDGWNILELGPLEAGHSYMFEKEGAKNVVAVEANTRAFLKCLCIKEILKLNSVEFKLGDFMRFLEVENERYDLVFASGVLYHMEKPIELLHKISKLSDRIFIWTQYYDYHVLSKRPDFKRKFQPLSEIEHEGHIYECATQSYGEALGWAGFCGGPESVSKWLTKDSLLKALHEFGFTEIEIGFEDLQHPNGPALAICAKK